jgi:hypothetical protein
MSKKLKTSDQSRPTKKQHATPCGDCPFARASLRGWVPADPKTWVMDAHGESLFECHTKHDAASGAPHQCAGSAIYRGNVIKRPRDPELLTLPANHKIVFSAPQEFIDHHTTSKGKQ